MSDLPIGKEQTLGPLPKADASSALRRDSVKALQNSLPSADFVFREEHEDDYGVDGTLEVLTAEGATNMRAQLQLKARSGTQLNADGSCSVSIETSNLNYLLNGHCPIYVLFRPEVRELRFAFARAEWKRISAENPAWRESGSITIRFAHILDGGALQTIRNAIVQEHLLLREVAARVTRVAGTLSSAVTVDINAMAVTDTEEIVALLVEQGYGLVNQGAAELVATKARQLSEARRLHTPQVQVVLAYAEYSRGRYADADASLRHLLVADVPLNEGDRSFATYLLHSIDLMTGRMDYREFEAACSEWRKSAEQNLVFQFDVTVAWERFREAQRSGERSAEVRTAKELLATVRRAASSETPAIQQQAELLRLLMEAQQLTATLIDINVWSQQGELPWEYAFPRESPRTASEKLKVSWAIWHEKLVDLTRSAVRRGDRELACRTGILRWATELIVERHLIVFRESRGLPVKPLSPQIEQGLRATLELSKKIGNLEIELQTMLELAVLAETSGDESAARDIASAVERKASLCRYANLERAARRIKAGEDFMSAQIHTVRSLRATAPGDEFLHDSEADLRRLVDEAVVHMGLPPGRAKHMLESVMGQKLAAEERRDWCRHIAMAEDVGGQENPQTFYAKPSAKRMHCMKLRLDSAIADSDPVALMIAFKRAHCQGCPHRRPGSARSDDAA